MTKIKLNILLIFFLTSNVLISQTFVSRDTTKSITVQKPYKIDKHAFIKEKYPSYYPLLVAFVLQKKAAENDPFAQYELGVRYLLGVGIVADTVKSISWFKKAASQKFPPALYAMGDFHNRGIGVKWDPFRAFEYYREAANMGIPGAQVNYGFFFTDNLVVNADLNKAYFWIKTAYDQGIKKLKPILLKLIKYGAMPINNQNKKKSSVYYFNKNKGENIDDIEIDDKFAFEENIDSIPNNREKLEKLLNSKKDKLIELTGLESDSIKSFQKNFSGLQIVKLASKYGSPESFVFLGKMHQTGTVLKKNKILAAEYFLRAIRNGADKASKPLIDLLSEKDFSTELNKQLQLNIPSAYYVKAGLITQGLEISFLNEKPKIFLKQAASQNHIPSIIELGVLLSREKDSLNKAITFYEKAIKLGSIEAEIQLKVLNIITKQSTHTLKQDLEFLKKASLMGSVIAQATLGYCFENGIGVEQNYYKAIRNYRNASSRGNRIAHSAIINIYNKFRPNKPEYKIYQRN